MNFFKGANKLKFLVSLEVKELANIPLLNAYLFVKWKCKQAGASGITKRVKTHNHFVVWGEKFEFEAPLFANRDTAVLEPSHVHLSIRLEAKGGKEYEEIGRVVVDLAEFAGSKNVSQKYLLLDSKLNSTLDIQVSMRQVQGDPMFRVPHRRSQSIPSVGSADQDKILQSSQADTPSKRRWNTMGYSQARLPEQSPTALVNEIFNQYHPSAPGDAGAMLRSSSLSEHLSVHNMHPSSSSLSSFAPDRGGLQSSLGSKRTSSLVFQNHRRDLSSGST